MQYFQKKSQLGFTFIELVLVMGIIAVLLGFTVFNLAGAQRSSSASTTLDTLVADIRSQQIKAMTGSTEGRSSTDSYGVHFGTNQYVLFHGTSYNPSDLSNFTVTLDPSVVFTADTFPSGNVVFQNASGEVAGFTSSTDSICLQTVVGGNIQTITFNQYGVITSIK